MKRLLLVALLLTAATSLSVAQQSYYDVNSGNGNGLRFWSSNNYKIHMGTGSVYRYGPVTDYSIKMNMSSNTGRGWTWGINGREPIAALSNVGHMQIAGSFTSKTNGLFAGRLGIGTTDLFWRLNVGGEQHPRMMMKSSLTGTYNEVGIAFSNKDESEFFELGLDNDNINAFHIGNKYFGVKYLTVRNDGKIGIGTTDPKEKLDIYGGLRFNGNSDTRIYAGERLNKNTIVLDGHWDELEVKGRVIEWSGSNLHIGYENNHLANFIEMGRNVGQLRFYSGTTESVRLVNGNLGIGTANPTEKLVVDGKIMAEEILVENVPASDYVLEPDYDLKPIEEVETFIKENKHLPDIPSAAEFKENGVGLGEMDDMLLRKVEELTLYVIELKKENEALKEALSSQGIRTELIITD